MELFINNQQADLEIAPDETIADLYKAISTFADSSSLIIEELTIDGKSYLEDETIMQDQACSKFSKAEASLITREQYVYDLCTELLDYVFGAKDEIEKKTGESNLQLSTEELSNLKEALVFLEEGSELVEKSLSGPDATSPLKDIFRNILIALGMGTIENQASLISSIDILISYYSNLRFKVGVFLLRRNLTSENINQEEFLEGFKSLEEAVKELNVKTVEMYQTGKDLHGIEFLRMATESIESYLFALKTGFSKQFFDTAKSDFDGISNDINNILSELISAFEDDDLVAVGDILEYELNEKIEAINSELGL